MPSTKRKSPTGKADLAADVARLRAVFAEVADDAGATLSAAAERHARDATGRARACERVTAEQAAAARASTASTVAAVRAARADVDGALAEIRAYLSRAAATGRLDAKAAALKAALAPAGRGRGAKAVRFHA
jgi:hypothetical protein